MSVIYLSDLRPSIREEYIREMVRLMPNRYSMPKRFLPSDPTTIHENGTIGEDSEEIIIAEALKVHEYTTG